MSKKNSRKITPILSLFEWLLIGVKMMFKRSKEQEKKGSEKREDLLVSFLKDAHFVFAIINDITFSSGLRMNPSFMASSIE